MEIFHWDDGFETGIPKVDEQHHWLVNTLNAFMELVTHQETVEKSEIMRVSGQMLDYARTHFRDEESMMLEAGVDQRHLNYHRKQHHAFIREIIREQSSIARDPVAAQTLLVYLGKWLVYHILGCDRSMAGQIAAIRAGLPPAEAFDKDKHFLDVSTNPLLHALNAMLEQVMERNHQLVQMNETLELRVAERTQELQEANVRLHRLALTDVLTGLPNRRQAMDRITQFWSEAQRRGTAFSCILVDIDRFKEVNDTYGHDAGDLVLQELARTVRKLVRQEDVVARLGGDEFLILCPQTTLNGALALAENLRALVHALSIPLSTGEWRGSISLGVAERNPLIDTPDDLIIAADKGLYAAKRLGRNRVGMAEE